MRKNSGFSLVELMIVVGIITTFATIAIPNFIAMQKRSKTAEVYTNINGIKTLEVAYEAAFDTYIACAPNPGYLSKSPMPWNPHAAGWDHFGWSNRDRTRCSYEVTNVTSNDFLILASCDVDGDGQIAHYSATASTSVKKDPADTNVY